MKTPIELLMDGVEWTEHEAQPESELPHATHSGVLKIGKIELRVYRLSTGQAIINAEDFERLFSGLIE